MDDIGPVYHASYRVQKGEGIGSFLGGMFRLIRPLFVRGAKAVGREALKTGAHILTDISTKQPSEKLESIIHNRISEAVDRNMTGSGALKRGLKRKRGQSSGRARTVKRLVREKRDIFD